LLLLPQAVFPLEKQAYLVPQKGDAARLGDGSGSGWHLGERARGARRAAISSRLAGQPGSGDGQAGSQAEGEGRPAHLSELAW
jgi:hypothetical protein